MKLKKLTSTLDLVLEKLLKLIKEDKEKERRKLVVAIILELEKFLETL